jgi:hypothetical protein
MDSCPDCHHNLTIHGDDGCRVPKCECKRPGGDVTDSVIATIPCTLFMSTEAFQSLKADVEAIYPQVQRAADDAAMRSWMASSLRMGSDA